MAIDYKRFRDIQNQLSREIAYYVSHRDLAGKELEEAITPYISNRLFDFGVEILRNNKLEGEWHERV